MASECFSTPNEPMILAPKIVQINNELNVWANKSGKFTNLLLGPNKKTVKSETA